MVSGNYQTVISELNKLLGKEEINIHEINQFQKKFAADLRPTTEEP